jgi:hypothetical protein
MVEHCSGCGVDDPATQGGVNSDYTACCNEGVCDGESGVVEWSIGPADSPASEPAGTVRACCAPRAALIICPGFCVFGRCF